MFRLQGSLIILNILLFSAVESICKFDDQECVMRAANKLLELMKPGIPGFLDPLDPLHEDRIEGEIPDVKYVLSNVTLTGMKTCRVELLSFKPKELTYVYVLRCTRLVVTGDYVAKGTLGSVRVDHEGSLQVTIDDYIVTFKGKNGKLIGKEDNKLRLYVELYNIESDFKGKVVFENTGLRKGDQKQVELAEQYLNDNWQTVSRVFTKSIMDIFMSQYMELLNIYLKKTPVDEILIV